MICVPRPSSVFIALQIIASLSNVVTAMRLEGLERRAPQTNAICSAEYAWADNSKKRSPCMMAAEVLAPCNGGSECGPSAVHSFPILTIFPFLQVGRYRLWLLQISHTRIQGWMGPSPTLAHGEFTAIVSENSDLPSLPSSWLAYNLISACSDCQGNPQSVKMYVPYQHLCIPSS